MKGLIKILNIILFVVLIALIGAFFVSTFFNPVSKNDKEKIEFSIKNGASISTVGSELKSKGLIKSQKAFSYIAQKSDLMNIKAGKYQVSKSQKPIEMLEMFNKGGAPLGEKLTIPEGFSLQQIADRIEKENFGNKDKFIELCEKPSNFEEEFPFLKDKSIKSLEGYLYPETYFVEPEYSEEDIIKMMLTQFKTEMDSEDVFEKIKAEGKDLNYIITLASIVEKETSDTSEKPTVAGVFINRLNKGMKLESCATVNYITGVYRERVTGKELNVNSPYNTYLNKGLPPSPICSPSIDTIMATVNPKKTEYLFFVARTGEPLRFSKTYEEHKKAVKEIFGEL